MQNLMGVRECNRFTDFLKCSQTFGKASEFIAALVESPALHQLHGVEDAAIGQRADVVHRDNSRMLKLSDYFRLAQQAGTEFPAGVYDPEHFQRDLPAQGRVLHAKDAAHAARTQLVEQHITRTAEVRHVGRHAEPIQCLV